MFQLQFWWLTLRAEQIWHHASALYIALGRFLEECGNSNVSLVINPDITQWNFIEFYYQLNTVYLLYGAVQ